MLIQYIVNIKNWSRCLAYLTHSFSLKVFIELSEKNQEYRITNLVPVIMKLTIGGGTDTLPNKQS